LVIHLIAFFSFVVSLCNSFLLLLSSISLALNHYYVSLSVVYFCGLNSEKKKNPAEKRKRENTQVCLDRKKEKGKQ